MELGPVQAEEGRRVRRARRWQGLKIDEIISIRSTTLRAQAQDYSNTMRVQVTGTDLITVLVL